MVAAATVANISQPELPPPRVQVMLPQLKAVHDVVVRCGQLAPTVHLGASRGGDFWVGAHTDSVDMRIEWEGLALPHLIGQPPPVRDPSIKSEVAMSEKLLRHALASREVHPENAVISFVDGHAVAIYIMLRDLSITYFVPVLA